MPYAFSAFVASSLKFSISWTSTTILPPLSELSSDSVESKFSLCSRVLGRHLRADVGIDLDRFDVLSLPSSS